MTNKTNARRAPSDSRQQGIVHDENLRSSRFESTDLSTAKKVVEGTNRYQRYRLALLTLVLGVVSSTLLHARQAQEGPFVTVRVAPQVLEIDLSAVGLLPTVQAWSPGDPVRIIEDMKEQIQPGGEARSASAAVSGARGYVAPAGAPSAASSLAATITANFDGIPATGSLPPDTVGDVGPNHYIQMVNTALAIYDKQGNLLVGPININSLWSGFGGPCQTQNNGDPIVRYDHLADRWLVSQFALPGGAAGLHECIALSQTGDPISGGWYLYDFPTVDTTTGNDVFPDYPKIGVWPDAYYMGTQRSFFASTGDVWAFERAQMLNGLPAGVVQFSVASPSQTIFLMPSDLDGQPPPSDTPNHFARQVDGERFGGGGDRIEIFAFTVDWSDPTSSTFTQVATLPTAPFDSVLCSADLLGSCIPQPGTTRTLESLTVWPMWRLQYRNFGTHESLVFNHTVDANASDLAGIRWYELRRNSGPWSIFQQATYAPDGTHRWMGSVAMDKDGGIALGYSVSSDTVFPGLRSAARLATDPLGTLAQGELTLVAGGGSQTNSSSRWGNYSSMDVDPGDDCTFWYTNEYYATTSNGGWRTRISAFTLPTCTPPPLTTRDRAFSFHGGAAVAHGNVGNSVNTGFTFNFDVFFPVNANLGWDLRLGYSRFPGQSGNADVDVLNLSPNVKIFATPPSSTWSPFVNGGLGLYYIDGSDLELGGNIGAGIGREVTSNLTFEITYNFHSTFTASTNLRFSKLQAGLLWDF